jgi:hypothetical protein
MTQVILIWVAAANADADTVYKVEADKTAPGIFGVVTTQDATDRGDGSYTPYSTTLNLGGTLSATHTSITLTDTSNFSEGDHVVIGKELIKLGTQVEVRFDNCTRGIGGTLPAGHSNGATVYKAHETFIDTNVTFGSRKVIRYRIKRIQDGEEAVGVEVVVVNPPAPPYTNLCTVWGILEDISSNPQQGVTVQLALGSPDNYGRDTGESIIKSGAVAVTDEDGFFCFQVRRDIAPLTLSMDGLVWKVQNIPEETSVNFLRT